MDRVSPAVRSANMRRIKSKDTVPERVVRRKLSAKGVRFRLHVRDLPGKPDIANKSKKIAVQVRGCFWHQHSCKVGHKPKSNGSYWTKKLDRNVERDRSNDALLSELGYSLYVLWECQTRDEAYLEEMASRIALAYNDRPDER